jgi:C-terminal peptidase prc
VGEAVAALRGEPGSDLKVSTVRVFTGERKELTIKRKAAESSRVHSAGLISREPNTGYVHISRFDAGAAEDLLAALRELTAEGAEAVVIDLRFNPGGSLDEAVGCADMFLSGGIIVRTMGRARPEVVRLATEQTAFRSLPVALLTNAYTSGTAEVFVAALRDNDRAVVVGRETLGRAGVQQVFRNPYDGSAVKLTTAYYYTPKGRKIEKHEEDGEERSGVAPDIDTPMPQGGLFRLAAHLTRVLTENASPLDLRSVVLQDLLDEAEAAAKAAEDAVGTGEGSEADRESAIDWVALPGKSSRDLAGVVADRLGGEVPGLSDALRGEWHTVQFGPVEWYENGPAELQRVLEGRITGIIEDAPDVELTP